MLILIGLFGSAFAAVGAEAPTTTGRTYYISTTGSDTAAGTQVAPFKTFARAVKALVPGDTLLVYPGTYYEGIAGIIPSGIDWTMPITIKAMNPAQRPVLIPSGGGGWPASDYVLLFSGYDKPMHHVIIDGLVLDGKNIAYDVVKLEHGTKYIRILNSELRNAPRHGLLLTDASEYNEFSGLTVHSNGKSDFNHGVYISTSNNLFENSKVYNNSGWGIQVYNANSTSCDNNTIRNNEVYSNARIGARGLGIGLYSGSGHQAYNNVVWGNNQGIEADYGAISPKIFNNTVYKNDRNGGLYGIVVGAQASNAQLYNNIIAAQPVTGLYSAARTPVMARNNLFYLNGKVSLDNTGTLSLLDSVTGNPNFANATGGDMHILAGGAGIDKGYLQATLLSDKDGIAPQNGRRDIGAYEATGSSPVVPTATQAATLAPTATKTPTLVPTKTPTIIKTATPVVTATKAATLVPTNTPTIVKTATPVATATKIATLVPSKTPTIVKTATPIKTATAVITSAPQITTPTASANLPVVTRLVLVNAETSKDIMTLTNGAVINTTTLGATKFNIRADVGTTVPVGSVNFDLNGVVFKVENSAPYAMAGDTGTKYYAWSYVLNTRYTVSARPYTGMSKTGTAGVAYSVTFTITNGQMVAGNNSKVVAQSFVPTAVPTLGPTATIAPTNTLIPTATNTLVPTATFTHVPLTATNTLIPTLTPSLVPTFTPTYLPSATPAVIPSATITETPIVIPTTVIVPTVIPQVVAPTAIAQVVVMPTQQTVIVIGAGQAPQPVAPTATPQSVIIIGDPVVQPPSDPVVVLPPAEQPPVQQPPAEQPPVEQPPVVVQPTQAPVVPTAVPSTFSVVSLTLVNVDTGADILTIGNGMTIDLNTLGTRKITIRANTQGTIGSVVFGLDATPTFKVENMAPYALYDDTGRRYYAWPYTLGSHTITATPYDQMGGSGTPGGSVTVQFTLVDSALP